MFPPLNEPGVPTEIRSCNRLEARRTQALDSARWVHSMSERRAVFWVDIRSPIENRDSAVFLQNAHGFPQNCELIFDLMPDVGEKEQIATGWRQAGLVSFRRNQLNDSECRRVKLLPEQ